MQDEGSCSATARKKSKRREEVAVDVRKPGRPKKSRFDAGQ